MIWQIELGLSATVIAQERSSAPIIYRLVVLKGIREGKRGGKGLSVKKFILRSPLFEHSNIHENEDCNIQHSVWRKLAAADGAQDNGVDEYRPCLAKGDKASQGLTYTWRVQLHGVQRTLKTLIKEAWLYATRRPKIGTSRV